MASNPTSQFNRLCVARVVELCEVNMNEIRLRAYAKVNLGLDVLRRREDGYHDVRMVMQNINLFDKIFIKRRKETGISVKSNLSYLPNDKGNLAYRAYCSIPHLRGTPLHFFQDLPCCVSGEVT